ncbi:hypothetical protein BMMON2_24080 [Burkholderia mallei]
MRDEAALRMRVARGLDIGHLEPGRARCDEHVRGQARVDPAIQLALEIETLGAVLLHEVRAFERGVERRLERHARRERAGALA